MCFVFRVSCFVFNLSRVLGLLCPFVFLKCCWALTGFFRFYPCARPWAVRALYTGIWPFTRRRRRGAHERRGASWLRRAPVDLCILCKSEIRAGSCACADHIRVRLSRCKAQASWYECSPRPSQGPQRVPFPYAPLRLARLYEIVIVIVIVTDPRGTLVPRPFGCSPLAGTGTGLLTGGAARFRPRVMHRACGADPVCRQRRAAPSVARHADLGTLIVQHGTSRARPARG